MPTSIIRDNHPVKRGRRIHPDRRPLSSELSRYNHDALVPLEQAPPAPHDREDQPIGDTIGPIHLFLDDHTKAPLCPPASYLRNYPIRRAPPDRPAARNAAFLLSVVEGSGQGGVVFCDLPHGSGR